MAAWGPRIDRWLPEDAASSVRAHGDVREPAEGRRRRTPTRVRAVESYAALVSADACPCASG
jgi:hypothetical protein